MQTVELKINGMHCAACEVLIERKFKKIHGVHRVISHFRRGIARVECERIPSLEALNAAVRADGYSVSLRDSGLKTGERPTASAIAEVGGIALILVALYLILKSFGLLPDSFGVSDSMSYGFVFIIGLIAAVSTCMAVTGGLLVTVAARYAETHPQLTPHQMFKPHLYFNLGRVVSYGVLGGVVGAVGSVIGISVKATSVITIIASAVMILLGFQMLHLFPLLRRLQVTMPKFIAHRIHDASGNGKSAAPFFLGAATFFLPCGFTQALQLYVLSQGDWQTGAITMFVFSLGTLPALMSISLLSSFTKGLFHQYFVKIAGVLVVLVGLFSINNGLAALGLPLSPRVWFSRPVAVNLVQVAEGKQVVDMKVEGFDYYPHQFKVAAGVPVEWRIDGRGATGCAQVITIPKLRIVERLKKSGITTISFTPQSSGVLEFSCTMGMTTPGAKFIVTGAVVPKEGLPAVGSTEPVDYTKCNPEYAMCL